MPGFLSTRKGVPLLLIPEYSGINKGQRVPDRSKTAHRKPLVKCFLTTISDFLEEISSLSQSVVFLLFLCIDHWRRLPYLSLLFFGTLPSDGHIFPSLLCLSLASLLFSAICKASSDNHFAFLCFFSMGMVLIPVSCTMSRTSFHSSLGTLSRSDLIPWNYFSFPMYNCKGFDLGHSWMV